MLNKKDIQKGLKIPSNLTPNLAYLCGIIAGDGSIQFRESKKEYLLKCVGNPKDEVRLYHEVILPIFEEQFGFQPKAKHQDNGTTYGFIVYSKSLINFLVYEIGFPLGKKYQNIQVPRGFLKRNELTDSFVKGLFDTDGCITFKKRYKDYPYYPTISFSSKSDHLVKEVASILKKRGFKIVETYNYKLKDNRIKSGFTTISRLELNGKGNLNLWINSIGFLSPKHLGKIDQYYKEN